MYWKVNQRSLVRDNNINRRRLAGAPFLSCDDGLGVFTCTIDYSSFTRTLMRTNVPTIDSTTSKVLKYI